jgi:hypothetical protein
MIALITVKPRLIDSGQRGRPGYCSARRPKRIKFCQEAADNSHSAGLIGRIRRTYFISIVIISKKNESVIKLLNRGQTGTLFRNITTWIYTKWTFFYDKLNPMVGSCKGHIIKE